jgi:hypothetical protein
VLLSIESYFELAEVVLVFVELNLELAEVELNLELVQQTIKIMSIINPIIIGFIMLL